MCSLDLCLDLNYSHWIFQGFSLFSYQGTLLTANRGQLDYIITMFFPCQQVFSSFLKIFSSERRRRDLNPRAAVNDLHPFQGCPFGQLGYFSEFLQKYKIRIANLFRLFLRLGKKITERVGFEPTRPCGQTVFKTASLWPLRYLSVQYEALCSAQNIYYH